MSSFCWQQFANFANLQLFANLRVHEPVAPAVVRWDGRAGRWRSRLPPSTILLPCTRKLLHHIPAPEYWYFSTRVFQHIVYLHHFSSISTTTTTRISLECFIEPFSHLVKLLFQYFSISHQNCLCCLIFLSITSTVTNILSSGAMPFFLPFLANVWTLWLLLCKIEAGFKFLLTLSSFSGLLCPWLTIDHVA